ncbi:helix-turn-helix domain-containing protein [Streptomyces sp. NPDC101112]|uniref:helix-turn-helix domain-containing protein n=1 Tax=Streptomyces sp. NPDC101112 TaxID=3366105 RepID=UPI00380E6956
MAVSGRPGSTVWLERIGPDGPLDTLILERAAQALSSLAGEAAQLTSEAQLRIACDPDAGGDDRRDAVRRLGLAGPVMVVVGSSVDLPTPWRARIGAGSVALVPAADLIPEDIRAGADLAETPIELPTALDHARTALRVAADVGGLAPSLVRYDDLGVLAEIIERFTPAAASGVPDVGRIDDLLAGHPWVVDTIQAVHDQPSVRRAAAMLHVHHSTLQERIAWLGGQLGYDPSVGRGRQRAGLSLLLWRVSRSDG